MANANPEQLDQMATAIANCGANLDAIRGSIDAMVQGSGGMQIPGVMEDAASISSAVSSAREKANALAAKLRGKAEQIRSILGG